MSGSGDEVTRVMMALHPDVVIDGLRGTASFEPQPEHRGNPGWLHGGLAAAVLDHICARVGAASMGQRVVTGTFDLRYPRPISLDDGPYRVEAEAAKAQGRMVRVSGAILDHEGRPMVEAKGLFIARPETLAKPQTGL